MASSRTEPRVSGSEPDATDDLKDLPVAEVERRLGSPVRPRGPGHPLTDPGSDRSPIATGPPMIGKPVVAVTTALLNRKFPP